MAKFVFCKMLVENLGLYICSFYKLESGHRNVKYLILVRGFEGNIGKTKTHKVVARQI